MAKKKEFIRALAEYLAGNQAEMSIKLQMGKPEAKTWADLRGKSPVFGYATIEEAEKTLTKFLNGD